MREYCFVVHASFDELEHLHELETGAALHQSVNLVLADFPYSTRSAQSQDISGGDVLCKENIEDTVTCTSNGMAFGAHGHILRSDLMFPH